jgi:subtilisin family serine protease
MADEPYFIESTRGTTMARATGVHGKSDPTLASAYPFQWNMKAIGAEEAWAAGKLGSEEVQVAIVDTGIDYLHPDLEGRVDLDRSGTVNWRGYPFGDDHTYIDENFPGREYFSDLHGHGTHVASVVASNAEIVAGVGARTKLMAVKVCNMYGLCFPSTTISGFLFAIANGADVVNLSLGGWNVKKLMFPTGWWLGLFFKRAFTLANRAGVTVVAAAGNDGLNLDGNHRYFLNLYCDMPNVLCVSATGPVEGGIFGPWTEMDTFAPYSNRGRGALSVAAPGGTAELFGPGTGGWVWGACSTTTWDMPECQAEPDAVNFIGTSQAAPHVSGVAALLVAEIGRRPELVRARIRNGADDLGQPGKDDYYGMGRLNVCGALGCR